MMRKILGPPGTGKTTRLLHYARTFLKLGTPIDKIGYFAFTKKAATEAKERMLAQNPHISEKELKHFRTLHSLAFWKLGMKKSQVMKKKIILTRNQSLDQMWWKIFKWYADSTLNKHFFHFITIPIKYNCR